MSIGDFSSWRPSSLNAPGVASHLSRLGLSLVEILYTRGEKVEELLVCDLTALV